MADPLSAIAIATFAFLNHLAQTEGGKKFVESIVGELGKKTLEAGLGKVGELKGKIVGRLSGNPKAEAAIAAAETGDQKALNTIAAHLQLEMDEDETFATEIKQIAQQIINIGKIEGENIQNIYGGQGQQITGEGATVYQVGPNSTLHIGQKPD